MATVPLGCASGCGSPSMPGMLSAMVVVMAVCRMTSGSSGRLGWKKANTLGRAGGIVGVSASRGWSAVEGQRIVVLGFLQAGCWHSCALIALPATHTPAGDRGKLAQMTGRQGARVAATSAAAPSLQQQQQACPAHASWPLTSCCCPGAASCPPSWPPCAPPRTASPAASQGGDRSAGRQIVPLCACTCPVCLHLPCVPAPTLAEALNNLSTRWLTPTTGCYLYQ
jgi:hypothetical protein